MSFLQKGRSTVICTRRIRVSRFKERFERSWVSEGTCEIFEVRNENSLRIVLIHLIGPSKMLGFWCSHCSCWTLAVVAVKDRSITPQMSSSILFEFTVIGFKDDLSNRKTNPSLFR